MAPTSTVCEARSRKDSESEDECLRFEKPIIDNTHVKFSPLAIIFVGLPARGKTVLAHKLAHYFNWSNRQARVFSVSFYRRKHVELYDNHNLFRHDNPEAFELRQLSMREAQEDATDWIRSGGEIAILDGTHATQLIRVNAHNNLIKATGCKVLFVECICTDEELLDFNVREMLQFNRDYKQMSMEEALIDYRYKIEHYKEIYEPMDTNTEASYSYIKVVNAGQSLSVRHIQGPLERDTLNFITCFNPLEKTYYFSRHGESENNVLGKIGGDANLSARGRKYAAALARHFNGAGIAGLHVWTSQKKRTKQTAQDIKAPMEHISALDELDAGVCEGLTYEEMHEKYPQEFAWRDQDKLRYRYPWGESYIDIVDRLRPILMELEQENNVLVISHQAVLRCMLAFFLNKLPEELPYINVPLHTIIKLTTHGYKYKMEVIKLNVECVDTYREQPKNCSTVRSTDEALKTIPDHYEDLKQKNWVRNGKLVGQH